MLIIVNYKDLMQTTSAITWASSEQQLDATADTLLNSEQQKVNPGFLVQRRFTIQALQGDITERYDHEARIGEGAFGVVYRVRDKIDGKQSQIFPNQHVVTGRLYAVKAILKGRVNDVRVFSNEVNILRELVGTVLS